MNFKPTEIPDVIVIEPEIFGDDRGFFLETYQAKHFKDAGIDVDFVQDNQSGSGQGVLRGLHYQIRRPQGKLVRVLAGEIFDVAVDIRKNSPTFGKWVGSYITTDNRLLVWIPEGFAHGFYVLSEWAEVLYKTTDYYTPEWERTILWDDPELGIEWPLIIDQHPVLSKKDARGSLLKEAELFY